VPQGPIDSSVNWVTVPPLKHTVAVLAIDPSSPFTQGALLGDRIRLSDHLLDAGIFIRSMASRGVLGGLSKAALQAALLMDASGRDVILLETVGRTVVALGMRPPLPGRTRAALLVVAVADDHRLPLTTADAERGDAAC
jgi:hypothetical protein